jgi:hypothetical protein
MQKKIKEKKNFSLTYTHKESKKRIPEGKEKRKK